jgi:hypothetical protein
MAPTRHAEAGSHISQIDLPRFLHPRKDVRSDALSGGRRGLAGGLGTAHVVGDAGGRRRSLRACSAPAGEGGQRQCVLQLVGCVRGVKRNCGGYLQTVSR